jgi:hypothetical protein
MHHVEACEVRLLHIQTIRRPDREVVTVKTYDYCGGLKSPATYAV